MPSSLCWRYYEVLGVYEETILRDILFFRIISTESHSALQDALDPNEDINVDNIWETIIGKDLRGKRKSTHSNDRLV